MPDAGEKAATALSLKDLSSTLKSSRFTDLPALRRYFCLLPCIEAGENSLARRYYRLLILSLRRALSLEYLPAVEVFIQNLIFRQRLRCSLVQSDSAALNKSPIFIENPPVRGGFHAVLELVCNHFILSLKGKGGFRAFLSALQWSGKGLQGPPEIRFQEAIGLINITSSFSLPGLLQAHLLLLALGCIDGQDLDSHVLAFEHFINLYVDCLPALGVFNKSGAVEKLRIPLARKRPLTCCIQEATLQKLENLVNLLLSFCQKHVGDGLPISDSDFIAISDHLIRKNKHVLPHGKFRQEATLIIMSILSKVQQCAKKREVHESDAEMTQEIICLAALLRVMGSLLLRIVNCFSQMRRATDNGTNANHVGLRIYYSILCDNIRLLSHYKANELHRCDFFGDIGKHVDRESASVQMLTHFASLSVFCLRRRLGFLWRVCIIMICMAINLMILEEDIIDICQRPLSISSESSNIPDTNKGNKQIQVYVRRSTREIAAQLGVLQNLSVEKTEQQPLSVSSESSNIPDTNKGNKQIQVYVRRSTREIAAQLGTLHNRSIKKTDGRAFLQCHPEHNSSWGDLVDIFECEEGKDYSKSLNQQKKFRNFIMEKYITSSMKKRKR